MSRRYTLDRHADVENSITMYVWVHMGSGYFIGPRGPVPRLSEALIHREVTEALEYIQRDRTILGDAVLCEVSCYLKLQYTKDDIPPSPIIVMMVKDECDK